MPTADQIGSCCGFGYLTTVGQTTNKNLFGQTVKLSTGTPVVIDSSGNIQWDRPFYCYGSPTDPTGSVLNIMGQLGGCSLSMSDSAEIGNYENIGAAMSPSSVATVQQDITQTYVDQCKQFPESCAIAGSQVPIVPSIYAAAAQVASPVVCGPFYTPELQPDGSFKCNFDPTNVPTWLLIAGAALVGILLIRR